MKIDLPVVEHMLKVLVKSPEGECVKVLDDSHRSLEVDLPDGVHEDEVEVVACRLDERGLAVGDVFYLKEAIKPEEKDDEDAPVEADEEAAKSPPDESDNEEADKEVTCGPQILLGDAKEKKPVDLSKKARRRRQQG